jgi:hypothetical protein
MHSGKIVDELQSILESAAVNPFELGSRLVELEQNSSNSDFFWGWVDALKVGRRRAYYLMAVVKTFCKDGYADARMQSIGWTKLARLIPYLSAQNREVLLQLAEKHTDLELRALLRSEELRASYVGLRFTAWEYSFFLETLQSVGGFKAGSEIAAAREKALLHVCAVARKMQPSLLQAVL